VWPTRHALKIQKNLPAENSRLLKFGGVERVRYFPPWEKGEEKKDLASRGPLFVVRNPMGLLSGRLGLKKLAFLQERDDWLSAAGAK
jgi:hypothetical protein